MQALGGAPARPLEELSSTEVKNLVLDTNPVGKLCSRSDIFRSKKKVASAQDAKSWREQPDADFGSEAASIKAWLDSLVVGYCPQCFDVHNRRFLKQCNCLSQVDTTEVAKFMVAFLDQNKAQRQT